VLWNAARRFAGATGPREGDVPDGAGADALLKFGDALPDVPIVRLGDAGMAVQMAEYVTYAVLRYFRRFDEYEKQARAAWAPLPVYDKADFTIGVMGLGVLGCAWLEACPVSASRCAAGAAREGYSTASTASPAWMASTPSCSGTRVLVSLLPLTPETTNLLDRGACPTLPKAPT
jgi:glyoxylate/hydroxypyruvate reductase A